MSTTFPYDVDSYVRPAPVLEILVFKPGTVRKTRKIRVLVDTGADNTILPISLLQELNAPYLETHRMSGVVGNSIPVDLFGVSMEIAGQTIRGVRAIGLNTNEPILGRDVLNRLILLLDGPKEILEIRMDSEL